MALGFSDYLAGLAVAISIYTLYQTSRYRKGDLYLEFTKERAELAEIIEGLDGVTSEVLRDWQALLAARGQLRSGLMILRDRESQALQLRIDNLKAQFDAIENIEGRQGRSRSESNLAKLHAVRARADTVVTEIEEARALILREQNDFRGSR